MSGVHGVEGFIGSELQSDLIRRLAGSELLAPDFGILLIHAVNPWGMEWWRRQNESNVDLNRNWMRDEIEPPENDGYKELHSELCPAPDEPIDVDAMLKKMLTYVDQRGLAWVRDSISNGQFANPDGMHYGGEHCEESTRIVRSLVTPFLANVEMAFTLDLHTGHGDYGTYTFLSDKEIGSEQDMWLRDVFGHSCVEATRGNPEATTGLKYGQIANGFAQLIDGATYYSTSLEFGTADAIEQLSAAYLEGWHTRCETRDEPEGAQAVWRYRCCFTPDDPEWVARAMDRGRAILGKAIEAVSESAR